MNFFLRRTCFSSVVIFAAPIHTTALAQSPTPLWRVDHISSRALGETRTLYIALPTDTARAEGRAVLVVLDAEDDAQFAAAVANVHFLASRFAVPHMIVVGIPNGADRTHGLTPQATGSTAREEPSAGGADRFADFLSNEVLPYVRQHYGAGRTAVLMGHSLGGLFGLYMAAVRPGIFVGTIAASPALWWNDSSVVREYASRIASQKTAQRIFLSAGEFEREIGRVTSQFAELMDSLHSPVVAVAFRRYPSTTHALTPQTTLIEGIRFVFEPLSTTSLPIARLGPGVDSEMVVRAVVESRRLYAQGARSLSFPEALPVEVLDRLGYNVINALKRPRLAAWVFAQNAEMHPEAPSVHDGWGDALALASDTAGALKQYELALRFTPKTNTPAIEAIQSKMNRLRPSSTKSHSMPYLNRRGLLARIS